VDPDENVSEILELTDNVIAALKFSIHADTPVTDIKIKLNGTEFTLQDYLLQEPAFHPGRLGVFAEHFFYDDNTSNIYSFLDTWLQQSGTFGLTEEERPKVIRAFNLYTWSREKGVRQDYLKAFHKAREASQICDFREKYKAINEALHIFSHIDRFEVQRLNSYSHLEEIRHDLIFSGTLGEYEKTDARKSFTLFRSRKERLKQSRYELEIKLNDATVNAIELMKSAGHEYRKNYLAENGSKPCEAENDRSSEIIVSLNPYLSLKPSSSF